MDILRHCVCGMQGFRVIKGIVIEAEQSAYNPEATDADFQTLEQLPHDFTACPVTNVDETSHQERGDAPYGKHYRCIK
jgi:hypothetical protein